MGYNIKVFNGTQMNETYVSGVIIDICTRTFFLYSDNGDSEIVECENANQFMNVLETCTTHLNKDQIEFADLSLKE